MDQVFDLDNWQVISFHNRAGTILDPSVTAADPDILKPLGGLVTKLSAADRRQEHIHFANVRVSVNFQPITGGNEVYLIDTFTEIPNGQETVHNVNGNPVVVGTLLGNDNIRTYTKAQFQSDVMDIKIQKLPTYLAGAQFGLNTETLDVSCNDTLFREIFLTAELRFIENQLFTTV